MPIRAENKDRYPANWKAIADSIRERAGQCCERCKVPNGAFIFRGIFADTIAYAIYDDDGEEYEIFDAETGDYLNTIQDEFFDWGDGKRVVLTVAHLDHQPENCDPENLRAWCQRCHNVYDAPMRKAGIKQRARDALANGDLFGVDSVR